MGRPRRVATLVVAALLVMSLTGACGAPDLASTPATTGTVRAGNGGSLASTPFVDAALAVDLDLEHPAVLDTLGIPELGRAALGRTFTTSFEDPNDLAAFYRTPQSALTHHDVTTEKAHSGIHSEKAWVTGAGGPGIETDGPNHRGYPTMPLGAIGGGAGGGFRSPTIAQFWVWLDVSLRKGQWFSFATFSNDPSTRWDRVVTVNLDPAGYVDVFHVPRPNRNDLALQRTDVAFPQRTWVRLTAYVDLTAAHGAIAVWQGRTLVAAATVDPSVDPAAQSARTERGVTVPLTERIEQAHFGLYTPPDVAVATSFNDDIVLAEVRLP